MNKDKLIAAPNREYWIDAVRSFACICVVIVHAAIPGNVGGQGAISIFNYYAVGGGSILFFMISGALIFNKEQETFTFLKTRFLRIFIPMVFWTLVYLIVDLVRNEIGYHELLRKILLIPFYPQQGTYWFIYVIFGIYLLTPMFSSWLNRCKKSEVELYLAFWGVTLILPYLELWFPSLIKVISFDYGLLYYFNGFLGFAVLGFYLRRYKTISYTPRYIVLYVIIIVFPWLLYLFSDIPHSVIQSRMSINHAFLAAFYFLLIKGIRFSPKFKLVLYDFAQHTFGIYLVHILVMKRLLWYLLSSYLGKINFCIQIPLLTLLTVVISYFIVHLLSKLPYSQYIVGYSSKK